MSKEQEWASKQVTMFNEDQRKQNSRDAREQFAPKLNGHKFAIWRALKAYGKPTHALHLEQLTDLSYTQIQRRLSELVKDGKIKAVGSELVNGYKYTTYVVQV